MIIFVFVMVVAAPVEVVGPVVVLVTLAVVVIATVVNAVIQLDVDSLTVLFTR